MDAILTFGKHHGQKVCDVPTPYLRWCYLKFTRLNQDRDLKNAIRAELRERAKHAPPEAKPRRIVDAASVLVELEDRLNQRLSTDPAISHVDAGLLTDHVMVCFAETRLRHQIPEGAFA